ncbi:hypothetical protein D3C86_1443580 [compost metagenome]
MLTRAQPKRTELALDVLRRCRLTRLGSPPDDVGDSGNLVDDLLALLPSHVALVKRLDDLIQRQPVHGALDATLLRKRLPVIHGDERVIDALLQHPLDTGHAGVVYPHHLDGLCQPANALGQHV